MNEWRKEDEHGGGCCLGRETGDAYKWTEAWGCPLMRAWVATESGDTAAATVVGSRCRHFPVVRVGQVAAAAVPWRTPLTRTWKEGREWVGRLTVMSSWSSHRQAYAESCGSWTCSRRTNRCLSAAASRHWWRRWNRRRSWASGACRRRTAAGPSS